MTDTQADLRVIVAHPLFALARELNWDDATLAKAKALIDITVIRLEERESALQQQLASARAELDAPVYDPEAPLQALKLNAYGRAFSRYCFASFLRPRRRTERNARERR